MSEPAASRALPPASSYRDAPPFRTTPRRKARPRIASNPVRPQPPWCDEPPLPDEPPTGGPPPPAALTVKVALLEVALPDAFDTTTRNVAPLSPVVVTGVV